MNTRQRPVKFFVTVNDVISVTQRANNSYINALLIVRLYSCTWEYIDVELKHNPIS